MPRKAFIEDIWCGPNLTTYRKLALVHAAYILTLLDNHIPFEYITVGSIRQALSTPTHTIHSKREVFDLLKEPGWSFAEHNDLTDALATLIAGLRIS